MDAMSNTVFTTIRDMKVYSYGQGETLVFCHGFTTTSQFWREQVAAFSPSHRVIVVDLPGHGESPAPRHRPYTIDAYVNDLNLLFSELGLKDAVLIGLSMGGTIAQRFALQRPAGIKGLVLVGATPHGLGHDVNVESVIANIEAMGIEAASQQVIERSFSAGASKELVEFAKQQVIKTPAFVAKEAIASLNEADSREELGNIALPTLVVCGEEDRITPPEESRLLAQGIPGAELAIIRNAAHFPMLEQPAEFNAILQAYLERLSRQAASRS